MKKLQIILIILSLIISALCVLYVAVGAAAEVRSFGAEDSATPEYILREKAYFEEREKRSEALSSMQPAVMEITEASPVQTVSLYASHYGNTWREYEISYTFSNPRFCETIPEGIDPERIFDGVAGDGYDGGKLSEGYTFLCVDAIIETKSDETEMVLLNMIDLSDGGGGYRLLGFAGQKYENTAVHHMDIEPGERFETTLLFAVEKDGYIPPLFVNPTGSGTLNGASAFVRFVPK